MDRRLSCLASLSETPLLLRACPRSRSDGKTPVLYRWSETWFFTRTLELLFSLYAPFAPAITIPAAPLEVPRSMVETVRPFLPVFPPMVAALRHSWEEVFMNHHMYKAARLNSTVRNHAPARSAFVAGGICAPGGTLDELYPAVGLDTEVPPVVFVTAAVAWPTIVPSTTSSAAICCPTPAVPSHVPLLYHFRPQTFPPGEPLH